MTAPHDPPNPWPVALGLGAVVVLLVRLVPRARSSLGERRLFDEWSLVHAFSGYKLYEIFRARGVRGGANFAATIAAHTGFEGAEWTGRLLLKAKQGDLTHETVLNSIAGDTISAAAGWTLARILLRKKA